MARESNGSGRIGLKCAKSACTPLCDKCVQHAPCVFFVSPPRGSDTRSIMNKTKQNTTQGQG
jgi:hypothetical protein